MRFLISTLILHSIFALKVLFGGSTLLGMAVNRRYAQTNLTTAMECTSGLVSGSPFVSGKVPCVLLTTASTVAPYLATVQLDGIFNLPVAASGSDIAENDRLYWNSAGTPQLTNNSNAGGYPYFGTARVALTQAAGTVTIGVMVGKYSV